MSEQTQLQPTNPLAIIERAIAAGMKPEDLKGLFDLQERHERNRAAEAFADAITGFQDECPVILKRRVAKIKEWSYGYAGYDDVMREIKDLLKRYRIAVTFSTDHTDKGIKATCRVRVGTHYEDHTLTVPVPGQMVVNDTQKYGAALSYAKRYVLCAALNIVVSDEDDDAAGLLENISEEQVKELQGLIKSKSVDEKRFLNWANIAQLTSMPRRDFPKALDMLKRKKADTQAAGK